MIFWKLYKFTKSSCYQLWVISWWLSARLKYLQCVSSLTLKQRSMYHNGLLVIGSRRALYHTTWCMVVGYVNIIPVVCLLTKFCGHQIMTIVSSKLMHNLWETLLTAGRHQNLYIDNECVHVCQFTSREAKFTFCFQLSSISLLELCGFILITIVGPTHYMQLRDKYNKTYNPRYNGLASQSVTPPKCAPKPLCVSYRNVADG